MALVKLETFYPDYQNTFEGNDIKNMDVYAQNNEKAGHVKSALVDEDTGRLRYLIVDTGVWIFGKEVLVPIGITRFDSSRDRVYVDSLSKDQVEQLPKFDDSLRIDYGYEEQVRDVYRPSLATMQTPMAGTSMAGSAANTSAASNDLYTPGAYTADTYNYDREPGLYNMNEQNHAALKLYEERLIANKTRQKAGEVAVGKHVETETARVAVPVEKERVVVERVTPTDAGTPAPASAHAFQDAEVARMEVYEETPDIHKEAVVREEVKIHKEVERDTVMAQEQVRREELDIDSEGRPIVERNR